ncbi:MAG TPA: ABC transporter substrate-binding protein [Gammaproteobacteria bacterium]|nr:ABC transporter substrate-binding protein [Gammaproteobacteria bacterium]
MKTKIILKCLLVSWLMLWSVFASAALSPPVEMLQNTTDQMLEGLKETSNRNTQSLYRLVRTILLPHADLDLMSQQVVGRYWAQATPAQREEFKKQFTYFITRTYSTALSSYSNQKVKFYPIRGGINGNRVQVNSTIIQNNGQNITVSYRLNLNNGQWKVYDFSVEGVSLVENYRSQFADVLRTQGMEGLLDRLKSRNASLQ